MEAASLERERSRLFTDPRRTAALLQAELPAFAQGQLLIEDCTILHTRFRTWPPQRRDGRPFLSVGYQLAVRDAARASRGTQLLQVRVFNSPARSRESFELARSARLAPPQFGAPVTHLPALDAVVWAFPNDPALRHLPLLFDRDALRAQLPGAASADRIDVEVVRYKPEVRCTTRYRLTTGTRTHTVFGKTFNHDGAREIARCTESLWMALRDDPEAFIVPGPLGCSESLKTVWQRGLAGTPLPALLGEPGCRHHLEAAARGLARLHELDPGGLAPTSLADRLAAVREESAELAAVYPALAAPLAAIVAQLENDEPGLPPCRDGLVHGDFLLKQLVVNGARLGVFDFDNFAIGDSFADLANFIVDLRYHDLDPELVRSMTAVFLDCYRAAVSRPVPAERLRWHVRVQLLRDAYYFHKRRHLTPGFEDELARILALAQRPD